MISQALVFIKNALDQHLMYQFGLDENIAVLNDVIQSDGTSAQINQNKIVITMINLCPETAKQFYGGQQRLASDEIARINPAIRFNIDLLFTANFDVYEEALKFLTATIAYFQANNAADVQANPELPSGLERLQFDIENLDFNETHKLWSAMGAKYRPSIMYKVRHVNVQAEEIQTTVPGVNDVLTEMGSLI